MAPTDPCKTRMLLSVLHASENEMIDPMSRNEKDLQGMRASLLAKGAKRTSGKWSKYGKATGMDPWLAPSNLFTLFGTTVERLWQNG